MIRTVLLVPLICASLSACDRSSEAEDIGWDVTPDGLTCTNPDLRTRDGSCTWYCRDFSTQKNADLRVSYINGRLRMRILASENC